MFEIPDSKDFGVYAQNFAKTLSACTYYRIKVPLTALQTMGLAFCVDDRGSRGPDYSINSILNADIALMFAIGGEHNLDTMRTIAKMKSGLADDGHTIIYPPTTVYDIDDNFDFVHPFNNSFSFQGTRTYPTGQLLEPGDNITTVMPDGEELVVWDDGITQTEDGKVFDIAANRQYVRCTRDIIRACHGVTVPSIALAKYMKQVLKHPKVYVFPNTIVEDDYFFPNLAANTEVRILWQGGMSHMIDWFPLRGAIKSICQKHKNIKFVIWGEMFKWVHGVIPAEQLEYHEWSPYEAYKAKRHGLGVDINLCPLAKNVFNACKSGIKWYEGSIGPRPEATLAANVQPYSLEIEDGKTGLLYNTPEEFEQKLSILIDDASLRRRLGEGARDWVSLYRSPKATIPDLMEFYKELRVIRHKEHLAQR